MADYPKVDSTTTVECKKRGRQLLAARDDGPLKTSGGSGHTAAFAAPAEGFYYLLLPWSYTQHQNDKTLDALHCIKFSQILTRPHRSLCSYSFAVQKPSRRRRCLRAIHSIIAISKSLDFLGGASRDKFLPKSDLIALLTLFSFQTCSLK